MFKETWQAMERLMSNHQEIRIGSFEDDGGLRLFVKNIRSGKHNEIAMYEDQPELLEKAISLIL